MAITAGIIGYMYAKKVEVPATQPSMQIKTQPQVAEDTNDWQTYRNEKYGFEFQYPTSWSISGESPEIIVVRSPENQALVMQAQQKIDADANSGISNSYSGDAFYFNNDMELSVFNKNPILDDDSIDQKIGETFIGGKKAVEYHMGGYGSNYGIIVENRGNYFRFDFKGCGTDECIRSRALSKELKQIISTFKFIN